MIGDLFRNAILRRALVEAILVGSIGGAVGVHVVLRRLPFFTMAVGHGTFPGVVVASLAGTSLLLGGWAFALVIVLATAALGSIGRLDDNSAVGVILAGSFALGTLLISTQPGFTKNLSAFLVGSILTVQSGDLVATAVVGSVVIAVLAGLHKEFVLVAFDRTAAGALGYATAALDLALLLCVAATVVTIVPAVGVVLSVALLVTPAATARLWSDHLVPTMVLAGAIGAAAGFLGLLVSTEWNVAAGGSIVLVATAAFAVSVLIAPRGVVFGRGR